MAHAAPETRIRGTTLIAVAAVVLAACGGTKADTTTAVDTAPIVADFPILDGSTSTGPTRILLACGLLDIECAWSDPDPLFSDHRWVSPTDSADTELINERVPTSGTHGSYETLITGEADIIIVARAPSDDELADADNAGVTLLIEPVARDAFVFLVNTNNPVSSLTLDQIRGIYTGQITDWSAIGGPAGPIQPYTREPTSGSQELMLRLVMGDTPMVDAPILTMVMTMMGPFNALHYDEQGIGYSVYYYTAFMQTYNTVVMIGVDGIMPAADSISDASYPLTTDVYAVVRDGENGSAKVLMDWLLTEEGQQAIADTGYVPLP